MKELLLFQPLFWDRVIKQGFCVYSDYITFRSLCFFAILPHNFRKEERKNIAVEDIERVEELLSFN